MKITPDSPEGTVREMAAALEQLYQDKELRARMGRAARKRGEERYHWDRLGEQLQEIYGKAFARTAFGLKDDRSESPDPLRASLRCGK
jgi:hypothetical protein